MKTKLNLFTTLLSHRITATAALISIGWIFSASSCQQPVPPVPVPPPAPDTLSQATVDADIVWAIDNGINDIYNQNLAGVPVGNQNITTNGPLGGTVHITGSDSHASNSTITTVDLTFDMTNCKITENGGAVASLSLTGSVTEKGSFDGQGYESVNFQSQSLRIVGTDYRSGYNEAAVNRTSSYSATNTANNGHGSTTGIIDGRQVSWTY
ncbi:MAG: hypothetical protein ACHQNE_00400 [Candidatus Kapaibacterium sp.]